MPDKKDTSKYGHCPACGHEFDAAFYLERSDDGSGYARINVDYLYCPVCGTKGACDDTFAGPWRPASVFEQ